MSMICLIMPVSTGLDAGVHESIDLVIAPYVRSLLKFILTCTGSQALTAPVLALHSSCCLAWDPELHTFFGRRTAMTIFNPSLLLNFLRQLFSSGRHQRQLSKFRNLNFIKRFCDLTWWKLQAAGFFYFWVIMDVKFQKSIRFFVPLIGNLHCRALLRDPEAISVAVAG